MLRKKDSIPSFIKEFGEDFFCYILNISKNNAQNLIKSEIELTEKQNQVLDELIKICQSIRLTGINQNDPNYLVYFELRGKLLENGTHIFNKWRANCGGGIPSAENKDKLTASFQTLGIETFPAFLMKEPKMVQIISGISIERRLKLNVPIFELITSDNCLNQLFNIVGDSEMNTYCSYVASTGQGGSIQLATLIDIVLVNSYYLMLLNGENDIHSYLKYIETNINLLREIAINRKTTVPVFIGYSNVALPQTTSIKIPQGQLMSFDEKFLKILPEKMRPIISGGVRSAFLYKGELAYTFKYTKLDIGNDFRWPTEMKQNREIVEQVDEDICIATSLACKRTPAVSLCRQWIAIFDPLNYGIKLSWSSTRKTPNPFYKCSENDIGNIAKWCNKIYNTEDSKIRLAKRKTINAISYRQNPIDGFIDAIIAWENLFGANAELSFRISSAISCLLEKEKSKRKNLFKKLKDTYNTRSSIVHGVKEISHKKAKAYREFSLEICLACITELYENYPKLIDKDDRSLTILLENS